MITKSIARASFEQVRLSDNRALVTARSLLAGREMCLPLAAGGKEPTCSAPACRLVQPRTTLINIAGVAKGGMVLTT